MDYVCKGCLESSETGKTPKSLEEACDHYLPAIEIILDSIFKDESICVLEQQSLCNGLIFYISQELKSRALDVDPKIVRSYH